MVLYAVTTGRCAAPSTLYKELVNHGDGTMTKPPSTEQECYDLGYDNPAKSMKEFSWPHLVFVKPISAAKRIDKIMCRAA